MALIHLPLSAFYVDDITGVIWGPDPNGTVVSPDGIRLAPQTPTSTGTDPATGDNTATYAAPTPATVQAATVTPPASSSSSSAPASSSSSWLGLPRYAWYIGGAAVLVLLLTPPNRGR